MRYNGEQTGQLTKLCQNEFVVIDDGVKIAIRQDPHVFLLFDLLVSIHESNNQEDQAEGKTHGACAAGGALSAVRRSGGRSDRRQGQWVM